MWWLNNQSGSFPSTSGKCEEAVLLMTTEPGKKLKKLSSKKLKTQICSTVQNLFPFHHFPSFLLQCIPGFLIISFSLLPFSLCILSWPFAAAPATGFNGPQSHLTLNMFLLLNETGGRHTYLTSTINNIFIKMSALISFTPAVYAFFQIFVCRLSVTVKGYCCQTSITLFNCIDWALRFICNYVNSIDLFLLLKYGVISVFH